MLTIKIGRITKRINSTKQTYSLVGEHQVCLKEGSSVINPIFKLNSSATFNKLSRCNYVEWVSDVGTNPVSNFYWIVDISIDLNNYIVITCVRDALATFKSAITTYNGIIARSSLSYDEEIRDSELMPSSHMINRHDAYYDVCTGDSITGTSTPALGQANLSATWEVIGKDGCQIFNIREIVQTTMHELINGGYSFAQGVTNPGQYIKSCKILPIGADTYPDADTIQVGMLDQQLSSFYKVLDPASINGTIKNIHFRIPAVGDTGFRQYMHYGKNGAKLDFRNYTSSFTSVKIWAPLVGSIDFPAQHLHCDYIAGDYAISLCTGTGKFMLKAVYLDNPYYREVIIMTSNIDVSIDVAIAEGHTNSLQVTNDICDAISTVASDIGAAVSAGAMAGGGSAGGAGGAVSSIGNAVANTGKTGMSIAADYASGFQEYTCIGTSGSLADLIDNFTEARFTIYQYGTVIDTELSPEKGRALMALNTIGSASKFIVMYAPSVEPDGAMQNEINEINATLASGIYIE